MYAFCLKATLWSIRPLYMRMPAEDQVRLRTPCLISAQREHDVHLMCTQTSKYGCVYKQHTCLQVCDQPETDNRKCHEREEILWVFSSPNFHVNGIQWFNITFSIECLKNFSTHLWLYFLRVTFFFLSLLLFICQRTLNIQPIDQLICS